MTTPNPEAEAEVKVDAQANPQAEAQGTEQKETVNPIAEAEPTIDYQKKFSESSKEALRLLEEKKKLEEENERLRLLAEQAQSSFKNEDNLYPGFEELDEEAKQNLIAYTESIKKNVKDEIYKDPSISFVKQRYNEERWNSAFDKVQQKFPELKDSKDEFRQKYFRVDVVPDNIEEVLSDVSKIFLFDKAKELGAAEEREKANRIEMERAQGGDSTPAPSRTLEDWSRMARENPAKFAKLASQYEEDLKSGKFNN